MKNTILNSYLDAKETVIRAGFSTELDWQEDIRFSRVTESDFLREAAWVVLSSGMRETVIRSKFPQISDAFYDWESSSYIVYDANRCRRRALTVFSHKGKIDAILSIARKIDNISYESFKVNIDCQGIDYIQSLPYMGPATSFHLAKNIGLNVVKPDRHLMRVAASAGYDSPHALCEEISKFTGDSISVVDIVIWRFATLNPRYESFFSPKF